MRIARSFNGLKTRTPTLAVAARAFRSKNKGLVASLFPRNSVWDSLDVFGPTFTGAALGPVFANVFSPKTDITETADSFKISLDLPGLKKEEVRVSVSRDGVLTIEGERKQESEKDEDKDGVKIHRTEKSYGKFVRRFELPSGAEPSSIDVSFKDGVLEITVPKPKEEKEKRDEQVLEIK
jgi:HSP20 family protein